MDRPWNHDNHDNQLGSGRSFRCHTPLMEKGLVHRHVTFVSISANEGDNITQAG